MARFEFVKRYLKPYSLWSLDEIKAGVTDKGDEGLCYRAPTA